MIPACGTRVQIEHGVEDSVEIMVADIAKKSRNQADPAMIDIICRESGPAIDWLATHGVRARSRPNSASGGAAIVLGPGRKPGWLFRCREDR